jgi:hypothetical protein
MGIAKARKQAVEDRVGAATDGRNCSLSSLLWRPVRKFDPSQRDRAMSTAYEDNFGFYCSDDNPEELAFFMHIKRQSIAKVCVRCNQNVHLQPQRILCATCTQALEYGAPSDPAWAVPDILVARGGT